MEISNLQELYAGHSKVSAIAEFLRGEEHTLFLEGVCASSAPMLFSGLFSASAEVTNRLLLFILDDVEEAGYFYHDLVQVLGEEHVLFFPSSYRRAVKYGQRDAANEILRTEVLSRISSAKFPLYVVSYPEAVAEKVLCEKTLQDETLHLRVGERVDTSFIEETLRSVGFERVDYVYEPGQYAVRGSIIDVFSFSSEFPYRIDFFGDEIDSIRMFDVQSQLSRDRVQELSTVPEISGKVDAENISFFSFVREDTVLVFKDLLFTQDIINKVYTDGFSQAAVLAESATSEMEEAEIRKQFRADLKLITSSEFARSVVDFKRIEIGNHPSSTPQMKIHFDVTPQPIFHKNFDLLFDTLRVLLAEGFQLYILADSAKQNERLKAIFEEKETGITFIPVGRTLHEGFVDRDLKVALFTDHQIFDRFHKYNLRSDKARNGKVALSLKELNQFEPGDFVVHVDHGVGRFAGLVKIPSGDTMQEVIKLVYQNNDVVFVSIHSLHKVSKYKGKENEPPRLNKLGTGAWENLKERTKKKIKDIARDLIRLYARRKEEEGYAFSPDSFMQHELEASFLYEDTPDQLKATQDVKADMERKRPMDRLVCGDVGFGKTEVAVRAAFKAACDNKQVAVLVPTTVLAYQHYTTFTKRLKDFPVKVEYLSRARTAKQTREVLKGLEDGTVNIVVGTHKLIGKNVKFKDLGLLIVDEEQKFGVSTKEKLRQIKVNVDTLTMTATPIPRTLQFSLMGARDLSVIQTPPPNRYPIQTEVHLFDPEVIVDAINFELSRNGQVFFVNNRISNLEELKALILSRIPTCRVCIGHGQMAPEEMEKVVYDFANYDYDVLISTTIVESGIDIPNANTIIINQAQHFGLSDLHQMRGRVGRSNKKAFCYLLAPPLSTLTPEARRRLQAIEIFSDLGSGIHIAMQDLDIRGAGNLLGAEQSGFIADLGYETYQKILSEAVKELRNEEFADLYAEETQRKGLELSGDVFVDDCSFESDLEIYLSETYVPGSSERMLLYRELDGLSKEEDLEAFRKRLEDRFGPIPQEAEALIQVVTLRHLGKYLGIEKILLKSGHMTLFFISNEDSPYYQSAVFARCIDYAVNNARRCKIAENKGHRKFVISDVDSVSEAVLILQQITERNPQNE
jgi:transcription-repair coupling factor (superfamily II helicase)